MTRAVRPCAAGCTSGIPADGVMLCRGCVAKLKSDLNGMEDLRVELVITLARQDRIGPESEGRAKKVAEPGSPQWERERAYNQRASNALHEMRNELVGWVRMVEEETGDPLPANRIVALSAWLVARLDYIAKHEAAGDIHRGIRDVYRKGTQAIDLPRDKTRITVGPCPEMEPEGDQWIHCPGVIVAFLPYAESYRPSLVCQHEDCGHEVKEWTAEQWARMGKRIMARAGIPVIVDPVWDEKAITRLVEAITA